MARSVVFAQSEVPVVRTTGLIDLSSITKPLERPAALATGQTTAGPFAGPRRAHPGGKISTNKWSVMYRLFNGLLDKGAPIKAEDVLRLKVMLHQARGTGPAPELQPTNTSATATRNELAGLLDVVKTLMEEQQALDARDLSPSPTLKRQRSATLDMTNSRTVAGNVAGANGCAVQRANGGKVCIDAGFLTKKQQRALQSRPRSGSFPPSSRVVGAGSVRSVTAASKTTVVNGRPVTRVVHTTAATGGGSVVRAKPLLSKGLFPPSDFHTKARKVAVSAAPYSKTAGALFPGGLSMTRPKPVVRDTPGGGRNLFRMALAGV